MHTLCTPHSAPASAPPSTPSLPAPRVAPASPHRRCAGLGRLCHPPGGAGCQPCRAGAGQGRASGTTARRGAGSAGSSPQTRQQPDPPPASPSPGSPGCGPQHPPPGHPAGSRPLIPAQRSSPGPAHDAGAEGHGLAHCVPGTSSHLPSLAAFLARGVPGTGGTASCWRAGRALAQLPQGSCRVGGPWQCQLYGWTRWS